MRINSITVNHFRSIINKKVSIKNYTLLIGPNNSGKSNFIDSIRVFYEKDYKFDKKRDFPKTIKNINEIQPWIEIEYQLNHNEAESIKTSYVQKNNKLKVRKILFKFGDRKEGIYGYEGDRLSDELFYGAKSVQNGKLGKVIYIPAISKIEDHTKLSGPSPLRDLLSEIMGNLVSTSESFKDLTREFENFSENIKNDETSDNKSFSGLENEINQEIGSWDLGFDLNIESIDSNSIIKNLVNFQIIDKKLNENVNVKQQGHGFQRHLIYILIKLSTKYKSKKIEKVRKEFSPDLSLILFEEPEAFLHPPQQINLGISLRQISSQDANQIIISSHSTNFVSQSCDDISSIIHLIRNSNAETIIGQINETQLNNIFISNLAINTIFEDSRFAATKDDYMDEMEEIKYFLWLDTERSGMFFANHVILVEGSTERIFINYLINTGVINSPDNGLFILDCMGKFNIHRFMNLLSGLGISHSVLMDKDRSSMDKNLHQQLKDLIYSSKSDLCNSIIEFPDNLENFLEIDPTKNSNRKPQHLLFRMKEGAIKEDKISEFKRIISDLTS